MDKVFEALEILSRALEFNDEGEFQSGRLWRIIFNDMVDDKEKSIIEQALAELKAIKEVKPSEAMEIVDKMANYILLDEEYGFIDDEEKQAIIKDRDTIKQALLKQLSGSQYTNIFIDEATLPNTDSGETLIKLRELRAKPFNWETLIKVLDEVEQALLKAQELEKENAEYKKVLEIIKKEFKIEVFENANGNKAIAIYSDTDGYAVCKEIPQEEFDLLRKWNEK